MEKAMEIAREVGFETVAPLDVSTLVVRQEAREMCAANKCSVYGKSWSCPPACGTLEECEAKMKEFTQGILVQSIGELEDSWDIEGLQELEQKHKERFQKIAHAMAAEKGKMLPLTAGCCTLCKKCAYPEPCRFPEKLISSMEAFGLVVNQVCTENGVAYYYGSDKMAYTGCVLF